MKHYTRFELIDDTGRVVVHYGTIEAQDQDDGRTLKVFIEGHVKPTEPIKP